MLPLGLMGFVFMSLFMSLCPADLAPLLLLVSGLRGCLMNGRSD